MRSKKTNILQVIILITGFFYLILGFLLLFMPNFFAKIFSAEIVFRWSQQLIDQFKLFYIVLHGLGILLVTSGLSVILPLFDPLKYRGLIYIYGLIFPFLFSMFLIISSYLNDLKLAFSCSIVFFVIFILNFFGIGITKKEASQGRE